MTAIPSTFTFSQSCLQAFEDCPRRFWLAFIEQLPWPAVEASPVQEHEALMRQGERFHRLVQRAEIGIDPGAVGAALEAPLADWFAAYGSHRPADLPAQFVEVERVLSIGIGDWGEGRGARGESGRQEDQETRRQGDKETRRRRTPISQSLNLQSPNLPISPPPSASPPSTT